MLVMCSHCSKVKLVNRILSPAEYGGTITYIKKLTEKEGFFLVSGNCLLGGHKNDGRWVDDIISHSI